MVDFVVHLLLYFCIHVFPRLFIYLFEHPSSSLNIIMIVLSFIAIL